jgi:hypothetical protein
MKQKQQYRWLTLISFSLVCFGQLSFKDPAASYQRLIIVKLPSNSSEIKKWREPTYEQVSPWAWVDLRLYKGRYRGSQYAPTQEAAFIKKGETGPRLIEVKRTVKFDLTGGWKPNQSEMEAQCLERAKYRAEFFCNSDVLAKPVREKITYEEQPESMIYRWARVDCAVEYQCVEKRSCPNCPETYTYIPAESLGSFL